MLKRRPSVARVVEPEAKRTLSSLGEVRHDGVVGVHDERRGGWECVHGLSPALGDELELAVAVELVAEEVRERDHARARARDRLRQRSLVHLEQAEVGASRRRRAPM